MDQDPWQHIPETFLYAHKYLSLDEFSTTLVATFRWKRFGARYCCGYVTAKSGNDSLQSSTLVTRSNPSNPCQTLYVPFSLSLSIPGRYKLNATSTFHLP